MEQFDKTTLCQFWLRGLYFCESRSDLIIPSWLTDYFYNDTDLIWDPITSVNDP